MLKNGKVTFSRRSVSSDSARGILFASEGGKVKTLSAALHALGEISVNHHNNRDDIARIIVRLADCRRSYDADGTTVDFHDFAVASLPSLKVKELKRVPGIVSMAFDAFVLLTGREPALSEFGLTGGTPVQPVNTEMDAIDLSFLTRAPAGSGQPQTVDNIEAPDTVGEFTGKNNGKKQAKKS